MASFMRHMARLVTFPRCYPAAGSSSLHYSVVLCPARAPLPPTRWCSTFASRAGPAENSAPSSPPPSPVANKPAYLADLSIEQLEAATAPLRPMRVIAGPGSGKTRVLTSRIVHLIHHHQIKPWQIVAITFTNKAASEIRERLATALGPPVARDLFAGTFHSLCALILRRNLHNIPEAGRREGWSIYDADDSLSLLVKMVKAERPDWKAVDARAKAKSLQSGISKVKNAVGACLGFTGDEVVAAYVRSVYGDKPTPGELSWAAEVAEWFDAYDAALRDANAVDFDDLLGLSVAVLRRDGELLAKLRRRFRHILVDEFQDTNSPQYELVKLLANGGKQEIQLISDDGTHFQPQEQQQQQIEGGHVFVVGDPDQAIYGWRGADVGNMRVRFARDFADSEVYRMRDNYRSSARILTAAQAVIARSVGGADERVALRALKVAGPVVQVRQLGDAYDEAEHVGDEIAALLRNGECKDRDIAVLFRTHLQARPIEQELVRRNIPYVLIGGVPFWRRTEIQDVMAYLRLAVTMDDDIALDRVVNVPKRGIGEVSASKLAAAAKDTPEGSVSRVLFGVKSTPGGVLKGDLPPLPPAKELGVSAKAALALEEFRQAVASMRHAVATMPLAAALCHIISTVDYEEHVRKGGCGGKEGDEDDRLSRLRQLVAAAAQFTPGTAAAAALGALADDFAWLDEEDSSKMPPQPGLSSLIADTTTNNNNNNSNNKNIGGMETSTAATPEDRLKLARAFMDEAALYSGLEEGVDVDGVRLMTMHAAKGLEFEVVFVPGCVEGLVPLFNPSRGDSYEILEEETRLFFVSMTRAKRDLRLLHTKEHVLHGTANRTPNEPSRFLKVVLESGQALEMSGQGTARGDVRLSRAGERGTKAGSRVPGGAAPVRRSQQLQQRRTERR